MLLKAVKREKVTDKPERKRMPIRISAGLLEKMAQYHSPKEKSAWVEAAIVDLLQREIYQDADWSDYYNSDTEAFMALIDLDEKASDQTQDTFLLSTENGGVLDMLNDATRKITLLFPDAGRSPKAAIVRAAIRQRVLLKGKLLSDISFPS